MHTEDHAKQTITAVTTAIGSTIAFVGRIYGFWPEEVAQAYIDIAAGVVLAIASAYYAYLRLTTPAPDLTL